MSWLARIEVNADIARSERLIDDYAWHKGLWQCFPGRPDADRDFLTRIDRLEGGFRAWVLARTEPVCPSWCPPDGYAAKEIAPSFLSYRRYAFDLRANPVKTLVQRGPHGETLYRENGKRKQGKRVPLVDPGELRAWLIRKGNSRCRDQETGRDIPGGFRIIEGKPLEISPMEENCFRKGKAAAYHGGVRFRGVLEVTDRARFIETYHAGVGSAKGFGYGLLLLAPVSL
jgi:CRISPR system Cascade subunit CasE